MFVIENKKHFYFVGFLNIPVEIYIGENGATILFFDDYKFVYKEKISKNKLNSLQIWLFSKEIYNIIKDGIILEDFEETFSYTVEKYFKE